MYSCFLLFFMVTSGSAQKLSFRVFVVLATYLFKRLKSASWIYPGFSIWRRADPCVFPNFNRIHFLTFGTGLSFSLVSLCLRFFPVSLSIWNWSLVLNPSVGVGENSTTAHYPRHYRQRHAHTRTHLSSTAET